MAVQGQGIDRATPMGATLVSGGTTFRTWAPNARDVFVLTGAAALAPTEIPQPPGDGRLLPLGDGSWAGFVQGLGDGDPYLFWVRGPEGGTEGLKRDPYARELGTTPSFPNCPCLVREGSSYPWHDDGWRTPAFSDFIIYQLHVGVFWSVDDQGQDRRAVQYGRFLDVIERIPYLRLLGINAVQFLPIQEYDGDFGLGYAGLDYFSPEMTYQVEEPADLARYLGTINALLAEKGQPPLGVADIASGPNQLKCLVDLLHLNGIGVIFDLVYNHAGGGFDGRSIFYYDRQPFGDDNRSLYFTDKGWAGGKVFAYWQSNVRQFLIDNAKFFLEEFHADGIRYDEVTVIHHHGGDDFCRDLTSTLRFVKPQAIHIAEYWDWDRAYPVTPVPSGLGFDAALGDGLRSALRVVLSQVATGASVEPDLDRLSRALYRPGGFPAAWRAVQCLENHDVVRWDYGENRPREPRIAALSDSSNPRSWYARSRSRVATTLLMTAPGIPMLFMGEEILEDKPWHDDIDNWSQFLVWWDGLARDRHMADFLHFTRDLVQLRRSHPALRGEGVRVTQVHRADRVIVLHRWVEGSGQDVVVVASFAESTHHGYPIGMPWPGRWDEVFNSDYYDHWPNPHVAGNGGSVHAGGDAYPFNAAVTIPANGAVVLARAS